MIYISNVFIDFWGMFEISYLRVLLTLEKCAEDVLFVFLFA